MIRKRLDELRQRDDRRLIVAAVELMEERVAIGAGVEEARRAETAVPTGVFCCDATMIRASSIALSAYICLLRRAIELERRRDADARELDRASPRTPACAT